MAENEEQLERLKVRLQWEGAGPLIDLSNQAATALLLRFQALALSVLQITEERPLISLLFASQVGLAVGRWGPRCATH